MPLSLKSVGSGETVATLLNHRLIMKFGEITSLLPASFHIQRHSAIQNKHRLYSPTQSGANHWAISSGIKAVVNDTMAQTMVEADAPRVLAYELVQGALVKWSAMDKTTPQPPTAVLLHGILGCRKNWRSFARRLAIEFPSWQFLLVDLRCHGDSSSLTKARPHSVSSSALDVLKLVAQLKMTPRVLIGHSFGGKVALSMVQQAAKPLPRPVRVWVLDSSPGNVPAGVRGHDRDHPAHLITFLKNFPEEVSSKQEVIRELLQEGFSSEVSQWVATNLRPRGVPSKYTWAFDLDGIDDMYRSYEDTNLWDVVENLPRGVHVNFLKAERSLHRWTVDDVQRIHAAEDMAVEVGGTVEIHGLEDAGHWVHTDNPDGLFKILSHSFKR